MIITFANWIFISASVFLCGFGVRKAAKKLTGYEIRGTDGIMAAGIAALTVYSEIYSIFGGVSLQADILMCVMLFAVYLVLRKEIHDYMLSLIRSEKFAINAVILILAASVISVISASQPQSYDTYLYHAQAIEWIEKYGAVKGLANLHIRFGYNSAFMCLQALFSWSFIGRSLHGMNGFICLMMLQYAVSGSGLVTDHRFRKTDILGAAILLYIVFVSKDISSAGSDILPMLTILYIFSKWIRLYEEGTDDPSAYGLLCLLALFALTAKLSVAPAVLLTIIPAVQLIKKKKTKALLSFIFVGILIVLPFLIREVILTGYLLYPLESLDLFDFDWKVPAENVRSDRNLISLYGKSMQNWTGGDFKFQTWFQTWYLHLDFMEKINFSFFGFSLVFAAGYIIYSVKHRINKMRIYLIAVCMILFAYWFFTAPLIRYGIVFLWLLPCVIAECVDNLQIHKVLLAYMILPAFLLLPEMPENMMPDTVNLIYPSDYREYSCHETTIKDSSGNVYKVYVPDSGDQSGYDVFPETPYDASGYIELRGKGFSDGFRSVK